MKEPDIYDYIEESKGHSGIENFDVSIGQLPSYGFTKYLTGTFPKTRPRLKGLRIS